jgi:hypothetical protein
MCVGVLRGFERVQQALVCALVCVVHIWRGVWAASRIVWILSSMLGLHCAHWQEWVCLAAQHVFSEGVQLCSVEACVVCASVYLWLVGCVSAQGFVDRTAVGRSVYVLQCTTCRLYEQSRTGSVLGLRCAHTCELLRVMQCAGWTCAVALCRWALTCSDACMFCVESVAVWLSWLSTHS